MHNIPKDFNSDVDNKAFKFCKVCAVDLSTGETPYAIEKAFKKRSSEEGDLTIFEIAICMPCAQKQAAKMSKHSQKFLQETMMNEDFMAKRFQLSNSNWTKSWKKVCLFNNTAIKENQEYHILGHFLGNKLLDNQAPFVMGPDMIEYIQENISVETKEEWDDFGKQFLGPDDPQLRALLEDYQFVMV